MQDRAMPRKEILLINMRSLKHSFLTPSNPKIAKCRTERFEMAQIFSKLAAVNTSDCTVCSRRLLPCYTELKSVGSLNKKPPVPSHVNQTTLD